MAIFFLKGGVLPLYFHQVVNKLVYQYALFTGHDTTSSSISWILYALAKHPEYQEKVHEEIDSILEGREDDTIQW